MAGNEAQVVGTELERVSPKVPALFDYDDVFYSAIEKRPVEVVSSRDMRIPLEIQPNGNTSYYNPDGGDLGRGSFPIFDKALISSVHLRHAVELTDKAMWSTDSNRKAVMNAFRHGMAKSMAQFRRDVDSQTMTDGTGVMATITTVSTTAGVDTVTCTTDGWGVRLLRPQQHFNIFSADLMTCRTAGGFQNEAVVTYYDLSLNTIQYPTVAGVIPGDLIVAGGLQMTPPVGFFGVKYHDNSSSSGTWLGFDRSTTPEIRANRVNAGGAAITLPLPRLVMNKIMDRIGIKEAGSKYVAYMHQCQRDAYEQLGFNVTRIDKQAKEEGLNLYFNDQMQMAGAPIKKSMSWDKTRIDFIDLMSWGRAELHPPGFRKNPGDGSTVLELRGPSGGAAAAWIFYVVASFNMFLDQPAGAGYIDNLAILAGYEVSS